MSLENAPDEVKLAVDLIMLLEENGVAPQTVLGALAIVTRDFERKVREGGVPPDALPPVPSPAERGEKT
ncbi:pleiotropic regulatory protein RsmS [Pluralibacter gergoviae]|uniref:pleiotropic regulatory protein RsmS n=1 Tax=Pluralibacter gergoviae TaxID=61647 RepID=UPI000A38EC23|nr:pleiotropic regulatory protein RsmS [Pluralibacter gergoviae]EKT9641341.1 pleiotropic regulatory protein RsmS [Pluralibacter gergoviae]EKV9900472.1 pleiotropic regulatory protein RsmS [Pluralibacter gergoviae]EKV9932483.1 pleiotropic regulatory protein RsmS [Pluralibacter gergoviae]EKW9975774.1 pleiotropic regulatory protein RsmS [Pluralibacter gergoviae]EMD1657126.1 pleiotropic regulatory protein RsmS [Pluralibacter gergoviae]